MYLLILNLTYRIRVGSTPVSGDTTTWTYDPNGSGLLTSNTDAAGKERARHL